MERQSELAVTRRKLLQLGSASLVAASAGCMTGGANSNNSSPDANTNTSNTSTASPTATSTATPAPPIPYSSQYGTVVDLVEDGGADPSGKTSLIPTLREYAADDTLLYLPEGEYLMDGVFEFPKFEHAAIVGDGATIRVPENYDRYLFAIGAVGEASDFLFEGIEFDCRARDAAPRPVQITVTDGLTARDISVLGTTGTCRFDVTSPDGSGTVERLRLPDGGITEMANPGCFVGPITHGELTFVDCQVTGFPDNGLYASPSNGPVNVFGGFYGNNAVSSVRVSGDSTLRNVHVRCDTAPEGFKNMRGIRLRHGESTTIENCLVEMETVTGSAGGIVVEPRMGSATIRDTSIKTGANNVPGIKIRSPINTGRENHDPRVFCQNVDITGSAKHASAIEHFDRDQCRFEGVRIQQTGNDRDGISFVRTDSTVLRDVQIEVTGDPIVLRDSQIDRVNVSLSTIDPENSAEE